MTERPSPSGPGAPSRASITPTQAKGVSAGIALAAIIAAAVASQAPKTAAREGTRLVAYQDPAKIWTICTGRTTNVKPGDRATPAQCAAWLQSELGQHMSDVAATTPGIAAHPRALEAAGDFHYNAGPAWWLRSPMRAHFIAGRWHAGCEAFAGYVVLYKASRIVPNGNCRRDAKGILYCEARGLVARRLEERATCLSGEGA